MTVLHGDGESNRTIRKLSTMEKIVMCCSRYLTNLKCPLVAKLLRKVVAQDWHQKLPLSDVPSIVW